MKVRRSYICLIFTNGFPLLVRLYILNQGPGVHICARSWPYLVLSMLLSQLPKSILVWGVWWILCHQNTDCMGREEAQRGQIHGGETLECYWNNSSNVWVDKIEIVDSINFRNDICKVLAMHFRCNWINLIHLHRNLMHYHMLYIYIFTLKYLC